MNITTQSIMVMAVCNRSAFRSGFIVGFLFSNTWSYNKKNKNKFIFNHNKQYYNTILVAFLAFYDYERGIVI